MGYKFIILVAITIFILQACSDSKTVEIVDFSKQQTFNFTTSSESNLVGNDVVGIIIDVKGFVNGKVSIGTETVGGEVSGKVDTTFRGDWFAPKTSMSVSPVGEVKGNLTITLRFSKI